VGERHAFNEIGRAYLAGAGVDQDIIEATAWFFVAMMMGDPPAAENLALMFDNLDERAVRIASLRAAEIAEEYNREETLGG
jgi:TPR repeat protein